MTAPIDTPLPRRRLFLAGVLGAGTAVFVLLVARLLFGAPSFLETVADGVLRFVPLAAFDAGIETFGPLAKGLLLCGVVAGALLAGGFFSRVATALPARLPWPLRAVLLGLLALAVAELVVLPLLGAGVLASALPGDTGPLHVPLVAASLAYGVVTAGLLEEWRRDARSSSAADANAGMPRRGFLARTLGLVGGLSILGSAGTLGWQLLRARNTNRPTIVGPVTDDPFGPTPAVTPVATFYTVNKNLLPTDVDGEAWRLVIDGLVQRPQQISLAELRALPAVEGFRTIECISTRIVAGDELIGNQKWRGLRLSDLLERAGVSESASWILWEADDGFTESLPLAAGLRDDTWIVYDMGGAPLTAAHGFPARVLIAGRFGMKQPKWLRRIELADHDEQGYWEQRGWDQDAFVRNMSRIDYPGPGDVVEAGKAFVVYGVANSGDRGIDRVELSADDGATWTDAELEPLGGPLGPLTWRRWRAPVTLAAPGSARLVVRATDARGDTQEERETPPLPSGSTGWHAIRIVAIPAAPVASPSAAAG